MIKRTFLLILILGLLISSIQAQKIYIQSRLDTNMILIGEQAKLTVDLQYSKDASVDFPILQDTIIEEIEILDLHLDTILDAQFEHFQFHYTITSFDSGSYVIPAQIIIDNLTGDTIYGNPLAFAVNTYKIDSANQNKFFDIKQPIDAPWTFSEFMSEYYQFLLIALLLIILLLAILWYLKKRKSIEKPVVKIVVPKEAAHLVALRELTALKDKKLWQADRTKMYYVELSEIVRSYLENRFGISALEQTSHEIFDTIQNGEQLDNQQILQLKQILSTADMAKFAKAKPLANENDLALKNAFELVEDTKIIELKKETATENNEEELKDKEEAKDE